MSIRKQQETDQQQQKIAQYLDNCHRLTTYEEKKPLLQNSMRKHERKTVLKNSNSLDNKRIYGHNFTLKFPLQPSCKIPFSKKLKEVKLRNNSYFLLKAKNYSVRQTTKNLLITPKFDSVKALPGQSVQLQAKMEARCKVIALALCRSFLGLRIFEAVSRPVSQEYAVKDAFAKRIGFTFKNELGKFDKSVRVDSDGHKVTGGEIEYFRPEHADAYLRMPLVFAEMSESFADSMQTYNKNIELHLATLADMRLALKALVNASRPGKRRMPTGFKKSATVRGVC